MKKLLPFVLCAVLLFAVAACSSGNGTSTGGEASPAPSESQESTQQAQSADTQPEETEPEAGGTLIAYFSWSGNTEAMARLIQQETGGDLFEIAPAVPYTDDYNELLDVARQEQSENARPELAAQVENWESYDTVFVGYPDWWSDAPMLIYTFLESYDWTGKTLIPFCTSGGSGFGRSLNNLEASAPGASILDGLHVRGDAVENSAGEVSDWIAGLEQN